MEKIKTKIFNDIGGFETLEKVHKIFYDKIYAHPWVGQFFQGHDQKFIEKQQTYFMAEKMGGPKEYRGKTTAYTHEHMYITDELFQTRQCLLLESLREARVAENHILSWLFIDDAFKQQIVNENYENFKNQYTFKKRVVVPKDSTEVLA